MMEPAIEARFNELVEGRSKDPHRILGLHMDDDGAVIRAFNPSSRIIDIKNIFTDQIYHTAVFPASVNSLPMS